MEDERILTVYEFLTPRNVKEKYGRIMLQGKWLTDLGFTVGKKVSVQIGNINDKVELSISLVD